MPAPRRGANTPSTGRTPTAHDTAIDNSDPTWNTSLAKLPPFLAALKRNDLLFNSVNHALSLIIRGYVVDSKHKKIVNSWRHLRHVIANPSERFSFEAPSDPKKFTADPAADLAAKVALGVEHTYTGADADSALSARRDLSLSVHQPVVSLSVRPVVSLSAQPVVASWLRDVSYHCS